MRLPLLCLPQVKEKLMAALRRVEVFHGLSEEQASIVRMLRVHMLSVRTRVVHCNDWHMPNIE